MDNRLIDNGQIRRAPAVVLLHAGGLDARMFDADMSALSRLGHVVRHDRRGRGTEASNVATDHIAQLRALIDRECSGRALLVGSSFGGQLAVDFALAHRERVTALLLVGPGLTGHLESPRRRARMARLAAAAARHGRDGLVRAWLEDRHLAPHGFPAAITRSVSDMLRDSAPLFLAPPQSAPLPTALPRLGRLKPPGRVYVGELDDTDNHEIAQTLTDGAQALELHIVRAAGHFPMLERVGLLPKALAALLDELNPQA